MLALQVRVGLIEGALTTVAGVFGGAAVVVEVELSADLIVIEGGDIIGAEKLVKVIGAVEGFVAMGVEVNLILMLAEGSETEVESELNFTE